VSFLSFEGDSKKREHLGSKRQGREEEEEGGWLLVAVVVVSSSTSSTSKCCCESVVYTSLLTFFCLIYAVPGYEKLISRQTPRIPAESVFIPEKKKYSSNHDEIEEMVRRDKQERAILPSIHLHDSFCHSNSNSV